MLHLKTHHKLHLPTLRYQPLQLATVQNDDDELTQAIANDVNTHDDNWTLEAAPDTRELNTFWSHVQDDISHDPTWQRFDEE